MHLMQRLEPTLRQWGYQGIFLGVVLGNIGLPLPEESIVLFAGYLAWRGTLDLRYVMLVAFVSAVVGDNLGYWIGRLGGEPFLRRYGRYVGVSEKLLDRGKRFFAAHGVKAVFLARFITGFRFLAGPMAGAARMSFRRFFASNSFGAALWIAVIVPLGYFFGSHLELLLGYLRRVEHLVLLFAALAAAGLLARYWLGRRAI